MVNPGGHNEELALLDLLSGCGDTVCKHLSLQESFSEDLEDGLPRGQADIVLALGPVGAQACPLATSQNDHSDLALSDLVEADRPVSLGVLSVADQFTLDGFE
jgi:hypothetical protein